MVGLVGGYLVGYALDVFQLLPHAPGSLFSSARCWKAVLQFHPQDRCRNAVFLSKVSKTLLPFGDVNTHELHNADPLPRLGSVIFIILIWLVLVGGWLVLVGGLDLAQCPVFDSKGIIDEHFLPLRLAIVRLDPAIELVACLE